MRLPGSVPRLQTLPQAHQDLFPAIVRAPVAHVTAALCRAPYTCHGRRRPAPHFFCKARARRWVVTRVQLEIASLAQGSACFAGVCHYAHCTHKMLQVTAETVLSMASYFPTYLSESATHEIICIPEWPHVCRTQGHSLVEEQYRFCRQVCCYASRIGQFRNKYLCRLIASA